MAIQSKLTSEMMAEELRVLYVAMTRAREKLIIIATFKDAQKETEKFLSAGAAPQALEDIKSMAGWILAAVGSDYGTDIKASDKCPIKVSIMGEKDTESLPYSEAELSDEVNLLSDPELSISSEHEIKDKAKANAVAEATQTEFIYPHKKAPDLPSKLTVTGLKGLQADNEAAVLYKEDTSGDEMQADKTMHIVNSDAHHALIASDKSRTYSRPVFIKENKGLTAAEQGIALHMTLQYIDFNKCASLEGILSEIQRLADSRILTVEQIASINAQKIMNFFKSDIGKRVLGADNTRREFKFSMLYPAEKFFEGGGDDEILLQGVVDCYFEENGMLTVLDFKTDYVTAENIGENATYYAPQLNAYAEALEKMTGKKVREKVIYFFYLDEAYAV